jgi:hypothetical protein
VNPCVAALGRVRAERLDWKDACPPDGQVLGYAAPA